MMKASKKEINEWIKKCPKLGKTFMFTNKKNAISAINNKHSACVIYINLNTAHLSHEIDCFCEKCVKEKWWNK